MRNLGKIDHGHLGEPLLELVQAGVHEALTVFGGVILGVLAQVPMGPGLENLPGQFVPQLIIQRGNLVLQLLLDVHGTGTAPVTL